MHEPFFSRLGRPGIEYLALALRGKGQGRGIVILKIKVKIGKEHSCNALLVPAVLHKIEDYFV